MTKVKLPTTRWERMQGDLLKIGAHRGRDVYPAELLVKMGFVEREQRDASSRVPLPPAASTWLKALDVAGEVLEELNRKWRLTPSGEQLWIALFADGDLVEAHRILRQAAYCIPAIKEVVDHFTGKGWVKASQIAHYLQFKGVSDAAYESTVEQFLELLVDLGVVRRRDQTRMPGLHLMGDHIERVSDEPEYEVVQREQVEQPVVSESAVAAATGIVLEQVKWKRVHQEWERALNQVETDPEGAITSARSLLESVCKHILGSLGELYDEAADLPKLYRQTTKSLDLAPESQKEDIFRQILGGGMSIIQGMSALRNSYGDSHGKSADYIAPRSFHARLAVNVAGTMATFLLETFLSLNPRG